ncbi:MAG TPA: TIGR04211 family SH3 domain-containing protein [Myxococcota bacterium]|nr:TIGR04211 family SH3 domain-containing protein [Myxococcota bacterium]
MRKLRATILGIAIGMACAVLPGGAAADEPAWVRGEVRVNFRASPLPNATPLGVVKTGDPVSVIERKNGWARIQLPNGPGGWLPESFLDSQPPLVQHAEEVQSQLASLREQLAAATRERDELREQNTQLGTSQAEREAAVRQLTEENRDLRAGERWPYLITGGAILGAGMLVGALVARSSGRRSSPRIRF